MYSISVRFGKDLSVPLKTDVARLTPLPNVMAPQVMFMGVMSDGRSAVFALHAGVGHTGPGLCRPDHVRCSAIVLKEGQTEHLSVPTANSGHQALVLRVVKISSSITHSRNVALDAYHRVNDAGQCELDLANPVWYDPVTGTISSVVKNACQKRPNAVPFAYLVTAPWSLSLQQALQYLCDREGSDLHVKAGSPPIVRISGELAPLPMADPLTPDDTAQALREMLRDPVRTQEVEDKDEACEASPTQCPAWPASESTPSASAVRSRSSAAGFRMASPRSPSSDCLRLCARWPMSRAGSSWSPVRPDPVSPRPSRPWLTTSTRPPRSHRHHRGPHRVSSRR